MHVRVRLGHDSFGRLAFWHDETQQLLKAGTTHENDFNMIFEKFGNARSQFIAASEFADKVVKKKKKKDLKKTTPQGT